MSLAVKASNNYRLYFVEHTKRVYLIIYAIRPSSVVAVIRIHDNIQEESTARLNFVQLQKQSSILSSRPPQSNPKLLKLNPPYQHDELLLQIRENSNVLEFNDNAVMMHRPSLNRFKQLQNDNNTQNDNDTQNDEKKTLDESTKIYKKQIPKGRMIRGMDKGQYGEAIWF